MMFVGIFTPLNSATQELAIEFFSGYVVYKIFYKTFFGFRLISEFLH